MKFNSQTCSACGGNKIVFGGSLTNSIETSIDIYVAKQQCPNCSGEGIEYIISPKQLGEYRELKQDK